MVGGGFGPTGRTGMAEKSLVLVRPDITGCFAEFLPPTLPSGVRVVLTCRPDIPLVQALRARLSRLQEMHVPPFSEQDFRLLLAARPGAGTPPPPAPAPDRRALVPEFGRPPPFPP